MIISRIKLKNWKNFRIADVPLRSRAFLVGPNASGKSNFLDAIRFLRDIAKSGGGLQKAVRDRGGLSKIRCLSARREPEIVITIFLSEENSYRKELWRYELSIKQESRGKRQLYIDNEKVWKNENCILSRPNEEDKKDKARLTQTHLEQINTNAEFRDIQQFLESIDYLHLIPQLIRHPEIFNRTANTEDFYGGDFLDRLTQTPEKTRKSRLAKIEKALQIAVPQLKQLAYALDERGIPHLEVIYEHWRPRAGKQREEQLSDGTLRFIGFLWSVFDGDSPLLLEEPELSLHSSIVNKIPALIWRIRKKKRRQIIISTHSGELLSDKGIGGEEILILKPSAEGTIVEIASHSAQTRILLEEGLSPAEAVIPETEPKEVPQLNMFNGQ